MAELDAVSEWLYTLRPEEFTAARDGAAANARAAGDRRLARAIGGLRRPTLSAWAGNLLVRERPGEADRMVRLGAALRRAHRELDGERLRELSRRQAQVVDAMARQAADLAAAAGHRIGVDAQREVEATLHAVLADPDAAREWTAGRLARPITGPTGFAAAAGERAAPDRRDGGAPED